MLCPSTKHGTYLFPLVDVGLIGPHKSGCTNSSTSLALHVLFSGIRLLVAFPKDNLTCEVLSIELWKTCAQKNELWETIHRLLICSIFVMLWLRCSNISCLSFDMSLVVVWKHCSSFDITSSLIWSNSMNIMLVLIRLSAISSLSYIISYMILSISWLWSSFLKLPETYKLFLSFGT